MFTVHRKKKRYKFYLLLVISFTFLLFGYVHFGESDNELSWEWVIQPGEYEYFHFVNDDWIAVQNENGNYIVMNTQRELVLPDEYEGIGKYSEGLAEVVENGKSGYINTVGDVVVECQYEDVGAFQEGLAEVKQNSKWGYINTAGDVVVECQYEDVEAFQEGLAAVKQNSKWGYINTAGDVVIECQYDEAGVFQEGLAAVKQRYKWGYIDTIGRTIVELKYDEAGNFSEGKAAVKRKKQEKHLDEWAYINKNDEIVIDFYPYSGGSECGMLRVGEFQNGRAFVTKDVYCFIDEKGNRLYEDTMFFLAYEGYSEKYDANPGYIYTDEKMTVRKYGLVSARGEQKLEPVFDYISGIVGDYVLVSLYSGNGELEDGMIRLIQR